MKKLSLLILSTLFAIGCGTLPSKSPMPNIQQGYYMLEADHFYKRGLCRVTETQTKLLHIELLENRKGSFDLRYVGDNQFTIVNSNVGFGGINRKIKGHTTLNRQGLFEGFATVKIYNIGFISRDHRKGNWSMSRASERDVKKRTKRLKLPPPPNQG